MSTNVILFGWNHPIRGRENTSVSHFQEFTQYLDGLKQEGTIDSYAPVFLNPHGGDMNGFFLITGDSASLDELVSSDHWVRHMVRANLHLEGMGAIRGVTGALLNERMELFRSLIPA